MANKIAFLLGLGSGYVLGAKAGRQRYEQIAAKAQDVWQDPRIQEKADRVQQLAKEKAGQAGSTVAGTVTDKAGAVGHTIADKVSKKSSADKPGGDVAADVRADHGTTPHDLPASPTPTSGTYGGVDAPATAPDLGPSADGR